MKLLCKLCYLKMNKQKPQLKELRGQKGELSCTTDNDSTAQQEEERFPSLAWQELSQ